ncbi:MAG TPA: YibE/F family protein, partial [Ilumatobacteraceae bacterium]|nr:YibE/F family protein [Ilumatobacteraceae bacterium]
LPLLLLFSEADESLGSVATREIVAVQIVRALVGSIGIVAAVPISTALAAKVLSSTSPTLHDPTLHDPTLHATRQDPNQHDPKPEPHEPTSP